MPADNIVRKLLFAFFFLAGAAAVCAGILLDDLIDVYSTRHQLKTERELTERLKALSDDYDALLAQFENDPNFYKRLVPVTFGHEGDPNEINPEVTAEQLAQAEEVLAEETPELSAEPKLPKWIERCRDKRYRAALFLAGGFLVLLSFIFFGPVSKKKNKVSANRS